MTKTRTKTNSKSILSLFNQYAGREVDVVEQEHTEIFLGAEFKSIEYSFRNESDPLIQEMKDIATNHKMSLRIWFPNTLGTMESDLSRVNVTIDKQPDGKWHISKPYIG